MIGREIDKDTKKGSPFFWMSSSALRGQNLSNRLKPTNVCWLFYLIKSRRCEWPEDDRIGMRGCKLLSCLVVAIY